MRLIDADMFEENLENEWRLQEISNNDLTQVREWLAQEQTVDAVPVRHGKWIKLDMHAHLADHKCTACGQECYVPTCMGEPMYAYCPNCGARMEDATNG